VETFAKIFLIVHIASGFTALLTGAVALATRKGGKLHRGAGKSFFWGMFGVLVTSCCLSIIRPNIFLFLIGIFSFYLAFTGYRILHIGKATMALKATAVDWLVSGFTFVASLFMLAGSFINLQTFSIAFNPILLVFGIICAGFAANDLRNYKVVKLNKSKHEWLFVHISRMCGAFIAATTAFAVINLTFLPGLLVWLAPTVIGSICIGYTIRKYKIKLERSKVVTS
jgi:uncharacterized membrane protein